MSKIDRPDTHNYSPAIVVKDSLDLALGGAVDLTWNSFQRTLYEKQVACLERQANQLVDRGVLSVQQAATLNHAQREDLVREFRKRLTPFGEYWSDILKPTAKMPSLDALLAKKGSYEAIIRASSRTRQSVNKIALIARISGPALITFDIVMTIVVVEEAPDDERGKVAAEQVGGMAGSIMGARYGGLAGAWAGSATFMLLASPTLVIPVVGEVTEGGAAFVGGIVGFFGGGLLGWGIGQNAGLELWVTLPVIWQRL